MLRLNPITVRRIRRFKQIKRGYYSLILLLFFIVLSFGVDYLANSRAILVMYDGELYFPTFKFYSASVFGQEGSREADFRKLKEDFYRTENFVLMPLIPYDPYEYDFSLEENPPNPPSFKHWLGTDDRGRDVLVRLLYGFRIAIVFAIVLTVVSQVVGAAIGCMMGYFGGWFDLGVQRFIEIWSTVPFLYLVIILASILEPNFILLLFIMALFGWVVLTYYMRTEVYREKSKEYCMAAKGLGAGHLRIVFKHLLPNSTAPMITYLPFKVVSAITSLTALDFLGYGLPPPTPSWGELMSQSLEHLDKLWLSLSPFVAIAVTLLLVTFIGEAVREAFDPKEYTRYS